MKPEALKFLLDIKPAIEDIESFISGLKNFNDYKSNRLLKAGVERKLLIIGEAINKFRDIEPDIRIADAEKIYGLRNRLAHGYDSIDDNIIYTVIKNYLPKLKLQIQGLIEENYKE